LLHLALLQRLQSITMASSIMSGSSSVYAAIVDGMAALKAAEEVSMVMFSIAAVQH
jgi:hypothetical protein